MWKMLQKNKPQDYVISTGKQYSVKHFINLVSTILGMKIIWKGKGLNEKAFYGSKSIIEINKNYFRPSEVDSLLGNSKKAQKELQWRPKYNIKLLAEEMIQQELKQLNENKK
jgi:GDPmannose 4,6-dehydratase